MVSGGRDSVCLLHLIVEAQSPELVTALHVNYGLRPAAAADELLCREVCERLGVRLEVRRPAAPPASGNLQAWAREVRYAAALALAEERDALVAVAHTASDQAETVLYRLASSPSRRALLGMPVRRGRVVRPLLDRSREEITAYLVERGLPWREDETNASDRYARGRVREGLLPALNAVHPAAAANVVRAAAILRDEAAVLDDVVSATLGGNDHIAVDRLRELPPALARLVVQRLADSAAGRLVPRAAARAAEIAALPARGRAALDIGDGVRAEAADGVVRFRLRPAGEDRSAVEVRGA
jgi:tRNA(Ile)-lysidine synthase